MRRLRSPGALALAAALLAMLAPAGHAGSPRVVGGTDSTIARWPAIAAITIRGGDDAFAQQFCGGTVIAPRFVLTAAHCVSDDFEQVPAGRLLVRLGSDDLRGARAIERRVRSVRVHPRWDATLLLNDVALLELARPVSIPPIRLVAAGESALEAPGRAARVAGWGALTDVGAVYPSQLQEAPLELGDPAVCGADDQWGDVFAPAVHLCAGVPDRSRDACFGDSGGPLVVDDGATPVQVGIVSFGAGCAAVDSPYGVYGRIAGLRAFIDAASGPDPGVSGTRWSYRGGVLRLRAKVRPNGERAFWSFRLERHRRGSLIQPFARLAGTGSGLVDVALRIPHVRPGRYVVRVVVVTEDGVTTLGRPRTIRLPAA